MQVTHELVPILDMLREGRLPAVVLQRTTSERWLIRELPVGIEAHGNKSPWSWTNAGDFLRIPIFPYQGSAEPPQLLAYAFQLGFQAREQLADVKPARLHMVVGAPLEAVADTQKIHAYKLWLGFAVLATR